MTTNNDTNENTSSDNSSSDVSASVSFLRNAESDNNLSDLAVELLTDETLDLVGNDRMDADDTLPDESDLVELADKFMTEENVSTDTVVASTQTLVVPELPVPAASLGVEDLLSTKPVEVEPKAKRTRTSPRTKALDEVTVMIDAFVADLRKGEEDSDEENAEAIQTALDLRGRVVTLAEDGVPKPAYNGRHYIGVTEEGTRVHFQSNMPPTKRSFGRGSKYNYVSVLGPFRQADGVAYRLAHPETPCPVIF